MELLRHRQSVVWWICVISLGLFAFPLNIHRASAHPDLKKVLIINSYNAGLAWSDDELNGIRSVLPDDTDLFVEYMDSKRQSGDGYLGILFQIYRLKYQNVHFDAVITLDDDAFHFILRNHDALFPGVPVVFGGVNNFKPEMVHELPWITGLVQTNEIQNTLDLAVQLRPTAEKILVVTDDTTTGKINRAVIDDLERSGRYSIPMEFLNPDGDLALQDLLLKLQQAPKNSFIYYADFFNESSGITDNPARVMRLVAAAAPGPVFVHNAMYVGFGATGGMVNSGLAHGRNIGSLADRVLNGEQAGSIPVITAGTNQYMFDAVQLDRWGIAKSQLPQAVKS